MALKIFYLFYPNDVDEARRFWEFSKQKLVENASTANEYLGKENVISFHHDLEECKYISEIGQKRMR